MKLPLLRPTKLWATFLVVSIVFLCLLGYFFWQSQSKKEQSNLIAETTYETGMYSTLWPAPPINGMADAYMFRMVLEPELQIGYVEHNGLVMRAWNYGLYRDKEKNIQRVAIPRAWEKLLTGEVYLMGTMTPSKIEGYTDGYLAGVIRDLDKLHDDRQQMAGVYFDPKEQNVPIELLKFYEPLTNYNLPPSFIKSGATADLPFSNSSGHFLPATQVMFDMTE